VITTAELVLDEKATLGEGPSWDNETKLLYWGDIIGKIVHIYNPAKKANRTIQLDQQIGALVPTKTGDLIVALQKGFYTLNLETEKLTSIIDPEKHLSDNRFNDGKCDAYGRFWAGTMSNKGEKNAGSLYCLDTDFTLKKMLGNVSISNGITWSPDNKTMYYIDTPTNQVVAFDFDLDTGAISNKRVVVNIPTNEGSPDGMTSDMEGMLWIAHWGGYQVSRWNPETGELIESVSIPAPQVTSCIFGGENLDELYITTARVGLNESTLEKYPKAGALFKIKTDVKGIGTFQFGG
jgi:sugar lactone lactonase YvrE